LERSDNQSKLAIDKLVSYLKGFKLEDKVYTSNIIMNDYVNQGDSTYKDPNCIDYDEDTIEALYTILKELDLEGTIVYRVSSPPPLEDEAEKEEGDEKRITKEPAKEPANATVHEADGNSEKPKVGTLSEPKEEVLQKVIRGGNLEDDLENDEMDEVTRAKMIKKLIKSVIASNNVGIGEDEVEGKESEVPLEQDSVMSSLSDSLFVGNPNPGKDTATTTTVEDLPAANKSSSNQSDNVDTDKRNEHDFKNNGGKFKSEEIRQESKETEKSEEEVRPPTSHRPKTVKKQRTKRPRKVPKVSTNYLNANKQLKNLVDEFRQYIAASRVSPIENTKKYIDVIKSDVDYSVEQLFPEMKEIFTTLSKDPFNEGNIEEMTKKVSLLADKKQNGLLRIHRSDDENKRAESDDKKDKGVPSLFYQQTLESILDGLNAVRSLQSNFW
jgi:hypothetical protein